MQKIIKTALIPIVSLLLSACTGDKESAAPTPPPQQPIHAQLKLTVIGGGKVAINGNDVCTTENSPCLITSNPGVEYTLNVLATKDISFYRWENCPIPEGTTCRLILSSNHNLVAYFVDPRPPSTPSAVLSDIQTGNVIETATQAAKLTITNDERASFWCVIEQAAAATVPSPPLATDPCWIAARPTTQFLGAKGLRKVFVFTKSISQVLSPAAGVATITYKSNLPSLSVGDAQAFEGDSLKFVVSLSQSSSIPVSFQYSTANGSGVLGVNYTASSGSITLQPGETSVEILVSTLKDRINTPNKTVRLNLSAPANADLSVSSGTGTIFDTDGGPVISLQPGSAKEGSPMTFTVVQSAVTGLNTSVSFRTENGSGLSGVNYTSKTGTVTIPAGEQSATFTIDTIDDDVLTPNKTVLLFLSQPVNATLGTDKNLGIINNNNDLPILSVSATSVDEGSAMTFTVTQSKVTGFDSSLRFSTVDGTAKSGVNYIGRSGVVVIPAGQTTSTFVVQTTNEEIYSPDRTFTVNLTGPSNALVSSSSLVATIRSTNNPPNISVTSTSAKKGDNLQFTVIQSSRSNYNTTFEYETVDGTAKAGTNYEAKTGTVTIPIGEESAVITVKSIDDGVFASAKNMTLRLKNPARAILGTPNGIGSIVSETGPTLSISDEITAEGNDLNFRVTLSEALPFDVSVDYASSNDSAIAGRHFTTKVGKLTLSAGQTSATITVKTIRDSLFSLTRQMNLVLVGSPNAIIAKAKGIGSIDNLDPRPSIEIASASATAGGIIEFVVTQSRLSGADTHFLIDLVNGTAKQGTNYSNILTTSVLTIPSGQITAKVLVQTLNAGFVGLSREFRAEFATITNAVDGNVTQATGTIFNSNTIPTLAVENATAVEGSNIVFKIDLSDLAAADVTFNISTANGSAIAGTNYIAKSQQLTIPAGEKSAYFTVKTIDAGVVEQDKEMLAVISAPQGANLGRSSGIGRIINNHGLPRISPPVAITMANEGEPLQFVVTQSAPRATVTRFKYRTVDGTALAGKHYTLTTSEATIPAGETEVTLSIPTINDGRYYHSRSMTVQIYEPTNAVIERASGSGLIQNINSVPKIVLPQVSVVEGETMIFGAEVSELSDLPAIFTIETADDSAKDKVNYRATTINLAIPAGQRRVQFSVNSVDDRSYMPTLRMAFKFSKLSNVEAPEGAGGLITNKTAPPLLSIAEATGNQGTSIVFTVTLSNISGFDSDFDYSTVDGSAKAGQQYLATNGRVKIPAGANSATFRVDTIDEGVFAPERFFKAVIVPASIHSTIAVGEANGNIKNTRSAPTITVTDAEVMEGEDLIFTANLSTRSALESSFVLTTADGSAIAGKNYVAQAGTKVTIPAGQLTTTFRIATLRDGVNTPTTEVNLTFADPVNANLVNQTAVGFITNGDAEPNLTVADVTADEGSDVTFAITASSGYLLPIEVSYATENGASGIAGVDYTATAGTITIPPGSRTATINVPTVQDGFYSGNKTFRFKLLSSTNSSIFRGTAAGTIRNIDPLPTLSILNAETIDGQPLTFTITQNAKSKTDTIVEYETKNGTAVWPQHYAYTKGTAIIRADELSTSLSFFTADQGAYGGDHNMSVELSDPANATIANGTGTGVIRNHYPPPAPAFAVSDPITGSRLLTNNRTVSLDIDNSPYAQLWCITESEFFGPLDGLSVCLSGASGPNVNNGWYTTKPRQFTIESDGDGPKKLHLWIADGSNKLSNSRVNSIQLDTERPVKPSLDVTSLSGANDRTGKSTVSVAITNSSGANSFCFTDIAANAQLPAEPSATSDCWVPAQPAPTTYQLTALGNRKVLVYSKSAAQNVSLPGEDSILYDASPPSNPILAVTDPVTGSALYIRQPKAKISITPIGGQIISKYCLSSSQTTRPLSDTVVCTGGEGSLNGWSNSAPIEYTFSTANDAKSVFLWVSDEDGNINLSANSKSIILDQILPTINGVTLRDPNSGSTTDTSQSIVSVVIGSETKSDKWIVVESSAEAEEPTQTPIFSDSRWTPGRPTSVTLTEQGARKVYIYSLSLAQNVSIVAESSVINYSTTPPSAPSLALIEAGLGATSPVTGRRTVNLMIESEGASRWCVSETQATKPAYGSDTCVGGLGPAATKGWFTEKPSEFTLSDSDGDKVVYLWVAAANNIVYGQETKAAIKLDRRLPLAPSVLLADPNTLSNTETNLEVVDISISQDLVANYWCTVEQSFIATPPATPAADSICWASIKPTKQTLTGVGKRSIYVFTKSAGHLPAATYGYAEIVNSNLPPEQPTLSLFDPETQNPQYVRQFRTGTAIGSFLATRFCVSEEQATKPAFGTDTCVGGMGPAKGWFLSAPEHVDLKPELGQTERTVYVWVSNVYNNVSKNPVSAKITVDTLLPSQPIVSLQDDNGQTEFTTQRLINLTIMDGAASGATPLSWCVIEQDTSYVAPTTPSHDSVCWQNSRPSTARISTFGQRSVYVFAKSISQNISIPGTASIVYGPPPPANPSFQLVDQSSVWTFARTSTVTAYVSEDPKVKYWCLSEQQTTRPPTADEPCVGGAGGSKGWLTVLPETYNLQGADGTKEVYLWVATEEKAVNLQAVTFAITLDTVPPAKPVVKMYDPNTRSEAVTNRRFNIPFEVTGATDAESYCYFVTDAASVVTEPMWYGCFQSQLPETVDLGTYVSGNRTLWVFTKDHAGNITPVPGSATIHFDNNAPQTPTIEISDFETGDVTYLRQKKMAVRIENDAEAVKWCVSRHQLEVPVSGTAACVGGTGPSNGWYTTEPTSLIIDVDVATNGLQYFVWVADANNNVSLDEVADYINYDPTVPGNPELHLFDPITRSEIETDQGIIDMTVGGTDHAWYFCVIEKSTVEAAPQAPLFDDPCWKYNYGSPPTKHTLEGQGRRQIYLFTKSWAHVVNPIPSFATILVTVTSPLPPSSFIAYGQPNWTTDRTESEQVYLQIEQDSAAVKFCVSETQKTRPTNGMVTCEGGQGPNNGWHDFESYLYFNVSNGDGEKEIFLWIADQFNNTNTVIQSVKIHRITPIYPDQPILSFAEFGNEEVFTTTFSTNPVKMFISNDENASEWCVIEPPPYSGSHYPQANDPCWTSEKPTQWTLKEAHAPIYMTVYLRSVTGHVSQSPGQTEVTWMKPPPSKATIVLSDARTGSTTTTGQNSAKVSISNDSGAVKWCVSETQRVSPETSNVECAGGQGNFNGWFTAKPSYIELSAGTGTKKVWVWIADKYDYVNLQESTASINVLTSPPGSATFTVVGVDTNNSSTTNTGSVRVTVSNGQGATQYCVVEQAASSGTPSTPVINDACWVSQTVITLNLQSQGLRDVFLFSRNGVGLSPTQPGKASIQYGNTPVALISSTQIVEHSTSQRTKAQFQISQSQAPYYSYKFTNSAKACLTNNESGNLYSENINNIASLNVSFSNILDGDAFLCIVPVSDPETSPNFAQARYFHWVKRAAWSEKAMLKSPIDIPGLSFGSKLLVWKNYLIVADPTTISTSTNYRGAVHIYQISNSNQVSLIRTITGWSYYYYGDEGFGQQMAVSSNGLLAVSGGYWGGWNASLMIYDLKLLSAPDFEQRVMTLSSLDYYTLPGNLGSFGKSFAFDPLNPDRLAVGWPGAYYEQSGVELGGVMLYKFNTNENNYTFDSFYTSSEPTDGNANIGYSLDIYGDMIVAGAPGKMTLSGSGERLTGGVYAFRIPSDSAGKTIRSHELLQGSVNINRPESDWTKGFGKVVRFLANSVSQKLFVLVGDAYDSTNGEDSGAVFVWERDINMQFGIKPTKLVSASPTAKAPGALFGSSIAVGGNNLVISAPGSEGTSRVSTVWSYNSGFVERAALTTNISTYTGAGFGTGVAIGQEYILIGTPGDTTITAVDTGILTTKPAAGVDESLGGVSIFNGYTQQ